MLTWLDYAWMPEIELAAQPIEAVNLACARGLPGTEKVEFQYCLSRVDDMADFVRRFTEKALPRFRRKRWDFKNSEAYFRVLCLVTALQRDMGVRYNPDKIPADATFDAADSFLHGILQGPGGTCATIPVLYAAVGRRLGYPIKLVRAYGGKAEHLFARWDDSAGERFNIEATDFGLRTPTDDYYRSGRYATPREVEIAGAFLQSMSSSQELAFFLAQRAYIWQDCGKIAEEIDCWCWAAALAPANQIYLNTVKLRLTDWVRQQRLRKPTGFPDIFISASKRRYPESLPVDVEINMIGTEITEHILDRVDFDRQWWEPMRRRQLKTPAPTSVEVQSSCYRCDYSFRFVSNC